jgi:hypothetical protein
MIFEFISISIKLSLLNLNLCKFLLAPLLRVLSSFTEIGFPSVDLACKFSIENPIREMGYAWPNSDSNFNSSRSFGFHGIYIKDYQDIINKINQYNG